VTPLPIIRLGKSDAFERFPDERRGGSQLSTPKAVVAVLVLLLAVNGFLFYRQTTVPSASAPLSSPDTQAVDTTAASGTADDARKVSSEPEDTASEALATTAEISVESRTPISRDLGEAIRRCNGDRKECMQEFVAEVTPEARYIGGRTDLNIGGSGRNKEILYFEDPNLGACEHTRQEYVASDRIATVIILGQGSFDEGRSECVPET
jgi:hypothetical protein